MKKSMVLIITIFFITAISALILQNLNDSSNYLKEQNYKFSQAQMIATLQNVQKEVSLLITNYKDNISLIEGQVFPFVIKDISLNFSVNTYEKFDINSLKSNDQSDYSKMKDMFLDNQISDFHIFKEIYNEKRKEYELLEKDENNTLVNKYLINTNKQIDDIISTFIKRTYSNDILKIKQNFGFLSANENNSYYEVNMNINYQDNKTKAYYILNEKGGVEYFELSFK